MSVLPFTLSLIQDVILLILYSKRVARDNERVEDLIRFEHYVSSSIHAVFNTRRDFVDFILEARRSRQRKGRGSLEDLFRSQLRPKISPFSLSQLEAPEIDPKLFSRQEIISI